MRWVAQEQQKEYGGVKGMMKWVVGDRKPSAKGLYQKMVEEADRLLDSVDVLGDPGRTVMAAVNQRRVGMGRGVGPVGPGG